MVEKLCLDHKIILNVAVPNDLPVLFDLVNEYDEELKIDKTIAKNSIREMVYHQGAVLAEYDGIVVGAIIGYVLPGAFTEDLIFSTIFFYVSKDYRHLTKQIIRELELSILPTKVTKIVFGVIADRNYSKRKRFMRMMGYSELETHYEKRI